MERMLALLRLIHPAPAAAVTLLSVVLAAILGSEGGTLDVGRVVLVGFAVGGSQIATGALNDWADRDRDAAAGRPKPIPTGLVHAPAALRLAVAGALLQLGASVPLGLTFTALGVVALGSALAYDLWLSRTPASIVPYVVSFGTLPLWVAAGVDAPLDRVAGAVPLAALFAAAAHLANTLRDWDADRATRSRALAQLLGRDVTRWLAVGLSLAVGIGVAIALAVGGRLGPAVALSGAIGLAAVAAGGIREAWLWRGQLVAAVAWTAAWALSGRT
jgi:4-hydroxybenzoate polyprenyltransferase